MYLDGAQSPSGRTYAASQSSQPRLSGDLTRLKSPDSKRMLPCIGWTSPET